MEQGNWNQPYAPQWNCAGTFSNGMPNQMPLQMNGQYPVLLQTNGIANQIPQGCQPLQQVNGQYPMPQQGNGAMLQNQTVVNGTMSAEPGCNANQKEETQPWFYSYAYGRNIQPPSNWESIAWNDEREINKAVEKERRLNQEKVLYEEAKTELRRKSQERSQESRRRRFQEVMINQNGEVEVMTRNLSIDTKPGKVVNFKNPELWILRSTSGEGGYYMLTFKVDGGDRRTFIKLEESGNIKYLLKKIRSAGGCFYSNKKADLDDIVSQLWSALVNHIRGEYLMPANVGWVKDGEHCYRFVKEGEVTWEKIMKLAQ